MRTTDNLIEALMTEVEEYLLSALTCKVIKAYEAENLPVPIRKIYLSFSGEENKVTYFTDENAAEMEKNDITVRINCFIPLGVPPSASQKLLEIICLYLATNVEKIVGFTVGQTVYDSDVDAYRITARINYSSEKEVNSETN